MRRLVIPLLLLALCACASADITRFDPPDPRLEKKISLDVDCVKLDDLAKTLTEQSGVVIKAGNAERDWKVREQKVSIHAKDITLGKALDQTAKLLNFCISREGKDKEWAYIIWQDKKGRDLETEMVIAQQEEANRRIAKSRRGTFDLAKDALAMSPAEATKQRANNPMLAYLGGTKDGRAFAAFLLYLQANFPTEYGLMMRGKRVSVPLAGWPDSVIQEISGMGTGGVADYWRARDREKTPPDVVPQQVYFRPASENGPNAERAGYGGWAWLGGLPPDDHRTNTGWGGCYKMGMGALVNPDSPSGKLQAEWLLSVDEGMPADEAYARERERESDPDFRAEAMACESQTEKNPPTDPELTREIEIRDVLDGKGTKAFIGLASDENEAKLLAEIARAIGTPVFREYYDMESGCFGRYIHPAKQPLYKVLIGLEKAGFVWSRDDGALRIRKDNWALLRSYQIPESFIACYKDLLDKNGELTLDDMAGMANGLTDAQIQYALTSALDLYPATDCIIEAASSVREILRFYASLSREQKAALTSDAGLPFAKCTNAQRDRLSAILEDSQGSVYVLDGSIHLEPLPQHQTNEYDSWRTFRISAQVGGEEKPRKVREAQDVRLASKGKVKAERDKLKKMAEEAQKAQPGKPAVGK